MPSTNPVFQVLTTSGNQAVLAVDAKVETLKNGQIGIFNYHTGLSVDGSVAEDCQDIFIAVGINRSAGGTGDAEDIQRSSGQFIQVRQAKFFTVKGYVPEIPKVVEVTGIQALADTAYGLKIEFRNQKSYLVNGSNQFAKTYNAYVPVSQTGEIYGNSAKLAADLAKEINADTDKLVTASISSYQMKGTVNIAPTADGNLVVNVDDETFIVPVLDLDAVSTVATKIKAVINANADSKFAASTNVADLFVFPKVSPAPGYAGTLSFTAGTTGVGMNNITNGNVNISDPDAFATANPDASASITITGVTEVRKGGNNDINVKYNGIGTDFIVTPSYGFNGVGSAKTVTEIQYAEGLGYDLKQLEYFAGGWNGKPGPYRQSELTGLAREGFEYFVNAGANYNVVTLGYSQKSETGWPKMDTSDMETIIGIPCADTVTLTGLAASLSAIFKQFAPMSDDVAAMDCSNTRVGLLEASKDGIEMMS